MTEREMELTEALRESIPYVEDFVNRYVAGMRGSIGDRDKQRELLARVTRVLAKSAPPLPYQEENK